MPLLGLIVNTDISKLYWVLRGTATYDATTGLTILSENAVLLRYGSFLETILNFLVIALSIFVAIKLVKKLEKNIEAAKGLLSKNSQETPKPTK
jgi:large conductance mechanosensitive channel